MRKRREDGLIPGILQALLVAWAGSISIKAGARHAQPVDVQALTGTNPIQYRVNYRPTDTTSGSSTPRRAASTRPTLIAAEVRGSGYQSQVVNDLTPLPHVFPDFAETSASRYYPTSNWASDYNYYVVPGTGYNYGWYGGYNPTYGYRYYPNYWWNGGTSGWGGGWGGHYWGGGWHRGEGFSSSHRNWNYSHVNRGTHDPNSERHSDNAHHQYHPQHTSAGHHQPGHHAAARHASNHSGDHRGNSHARAGGARTAGHRGAAHHAAGHASRGHAGRGAGGRGGGGRAWRRRTPRIPRRPRSRCSGAAPRSLKRRRIRRAGLTMVRAWTEINVSIRSLKQARRCTT